LTVAFAPRSPGLRLAAVAPDGVISYGQSWRYLYGDSFAVSGFNPQHETLLTSYMSSIGGNSVIPVPGPLTNQAGIGIPGTMIGITGYAASDFITIGRVAVLAQQLQRLERGAIPLVPIVEFVCAWPGASWTAGGGGGLAPGASFTASVTNDVMTVTAVSDGTLAINQTVQATGLDSRTLITGPASGTTGTYSIAIGQLVFFTSNVVMTNATVTSVGGITGDGGAAGNIFNVSSVISGTVTIGDTVPSPALAGTVILAQLDGVAGGIGNYSVKVGAGQTVGSRDMTSRGITWYNMLSIVSGIETVLPAVANNNLLAANFKSFRYTQGPAIGGTQANKIANLIDMCTKVDALNLPGAGTAGMEYFFGLPAANAPLTTFPDSYQGTTDFCRTNAPGAGGMWSGRCFATSPAYPWPLNGVDGLHMSSYGTARWGENEGYVADQVEQGIAWEPLWRSRTAPITVSGQVVTIPFARPTGPDFAASPLLLTFNATDGMKDWPNNGFNVKRSGIFLTVANVTISGLNILLTITQTLVSNDNLEVTYAWYGPGGVITDPVSGVGGNLVMNGPTSQLFQGKTIDAWGWPFIETVIAP
jgi:hypothetical protein